MDKITVKSTGIVMPAVSAEEAVQAFNAYQELANKIITPEDVQDIQGKQFKKKSFWRKCQRFFNLSVEIREEKRVEDKNGVFTYKFICRAKAPNKAYVDGTGTCSSNEKGLIKTEHNTRAIAETRAKNRAIADLVAFGEVSAEEIRGELVEEDSQAELINKTFPDDIGSPTATPPVTSAPDLGVCARCGAPNKLSSKGKPYCSKVCWKV